MNPRQQKDIATIFQNIPFLSCLSSEERKDIYMHVILKECHKNDILLYEEEHAHYMYLLLSGQVKVIQLNEEGKEHILAIHKKGHYFGEMSFIDGKTSPATVVAQEKTRVGLISREVFVNHILTKPKCVDVIIKLLCERLREAWLKISNTDFLNAEQRLWNVFKDLSEKFGKQDSQGVMIDLEITHQDIAGLCSTSRETVTRFLNNARKNGYIEIRANKKFLLKNDCLKKIHLM